MKIDIRTAHDIVNWVFLQEVLASYVFPTNFVHLVMICVTSPHYTIKVNRLGHDFFVGKKV